MTATNEGSPWFWRLFGSAFIGAVVFLLVTIFNHITANIHEARSDAKESVAQLQGELMGLKDKMVSLENVSVLRSDVSNLKERIAAIDERKERIAVIESDIAKLRDKISSDDKDVSNFAQKFAALCGEIDGLKKAVEDVRNKRQELREQIIAVQERLAATAEKK